jgi:hypothetical protein
LVAGEWGWLMYFSIEAERYVLIKTLPDGKPNAVMPVCSRDEGEQKIVALSADGDYGWCLFDVSASCPVETGDHK